MRPRDGRRAVILTDSQRAEAAELRRSGMTNAAIAARYGCCETTISNLGRAAGIPHFRANSRGLTAEQLEEARRRFEGGESLDHVACQFGVSYSLLRKRLTPSSIRRKRAQTKLREHQRKSRQELISDVAGVRTFLVQCQTVGEVYLGRADGRSGYRDELAETAISDQPWDMEQLEADLRRIELLFGSVRKALDDRRGRRPHVLELHPEAESS